MKHLKIGIAADYDSNGSIISDLDVLKRLSSYGVEAELIQAPMLERIESLELDGLILPGSPLDVDPQLYGEEKKYSEVKINQRRQELDWQIIEQALALDMPILGICFGMQILNVFFGGSLYQHIPADLPSPIEHEQKISKYQPSHEVHLEKEGLLFHEFNNKSLQVNSTHHQGVKKLGKNLRLEAKAHDGLIEAFSHETKKFVLGVEWHPERLQDDPVIPYFLKVCRH
ncbi:MAG: gamma-glutamyl-gamma-aminobutyrate hydrolase family protein [Bdellovibrionota bacterium]